jgi:hypothetical protein
MKKVEKKSDVKKIEAKKLIEKDLKTIKGGAKETFDK